MRHPIYYSEGLRASGFAEPEDPNARVWRFMSFAKYVALLESHSVFFARADTLGDPLFGDSLEGSQTLPTVETRKRLWGILPRRVRESSGGAKAARQLTFISCWHLNDHESQGMWRLYVGGSEGVAICSRFGALADCLTKNPRNEIYLGCVKYIDYQKDQLSDDWVTPFVHKRLSFRHESELRAVIFARSRPQAPPAEEKLVDGVSVEVDLNAAIDAVYTSPYAPIWFHNLVVSISKRFGLNVPIRLSALRAEPIY